MARLLILLEIALGVLCNRLLAQEAQDVYEKAAACPHRFHMGCMLDVLEKSCTGLQAVEKCAEGNGKCRGLSELDRIVGALQPDNFEALNKCCCSKAFAEGYEDCKEPNPICKKAISDHLGAEVLEQNLLLLKKCAERKNKEVCKKAVGAAKWVLEAVQKARGEMWPVDGCKILAPPEPLSACGWNLKPEPRAVERADLYCDTIIWQFKEMGASDPYMAQCKDAPKMPETKDKSEQGDDIGDEKMDEEEGKEGDQDRDQEEDEEGDQEGDKEGDQETDTEGGVGEGEEDLSEDEEPLQTEDGKDTDEGKDKEEQEEEEPLEMKEDRADGDNQDEESEENVKESGTEKEPESLTNKKDEL